MPYRVAFLGFSDAERLLLSKQFQAGSRRKPRYVQVQMLTDADFLIADADHGPSVQLTVATDRMDETVFIGRQAPVGATAWMMRPIDAQHVLRELDAMVALRGLEAGPEAPPRAPAAPAPFTMPVRDDMQAFLAGPPAPPSGLNLELRALPTLPPPPPRPAREPLPVRAVLPPPPPLPPVEDLVVSDPPAPLTPAAPTPAGYTPTPALAHPPAEASAPAAALTPAAPRPPEPSPRTRRRRSRAALLPPQRALIVDDSEIALRYLETRLQPYSLTIERAGSSTRALELLESSSFDLVFLDVQLGPDSALDGLQLCQLIKQSPAAMSTSVIIVTAYASELDRVRGALAGCDGYLGKPLDATELERMLVRFGLKIPVRQA